MAERPTEMKSRHRALPLEYRDMTRVLFALSGSAASLLPRPVAGLGHVLDAIWHRIGGRFFNSYRPERHYMRGPGPAWRAKHDHSPSA